MHVHAAARVVQAQESPGLFAGVGRSGDKVVGGDGLKATKNLPMQECVWKVPDCQMQVAL